MFGRIRANVMPAERLEKLKSLSSNVAFNWGYGISAEKTYDIEAWIPSENKYRELSMFSCGSFKPEGWELNINLILK